MTTVIKKFESNETVEDIFSSIEVGKKFSSNFMILGKYYKNEKKEMVSFGECPTKISCFPRTLTIYCKIQDKNFKIRWFYSNKLNKVHLASGIEICQACTILDDFVEEMSQTLSFDNIQSSVKVLANGLAQASNGVNLLKLSQILDTSNLSYVYTPDNHAALKIYHEFGTVCVHGSGRILYMGSKNDSELINLHNYIKKIGKSWPGMNCYI
tara:strand:+ start:6202 stop:6834 length:633 start_codon:yes stop_codon:yes gene_type:complete